MLSDANVRAVMGRDAVKADELRALSRRLRRPVGRRVDSETRDRREDPAISGPKKVPDLPSDTPAPSRLG